MILFNMCQKFSLFLNRFTKCVIVILLTLVLHAVKVTLILKVNFLRNCYLLISSISFSLLLAIERMEVISEKSFKLFIYVINKGRISFQFYDIFYRYNKKITMKLIFFQL